MFTLCLLFCGVLAQPANFPRFWIFMYRLSPFTYLVSGMLSTGLANSSVTCADRELVRFQPRSGETCGEYMKAYQSLAGGYLVNDTATSNCEFCSISDTNIFLKSISSEYSQAWRNFGKSLSSCL
jgi:ATP-binding cassette subfamily G (WHITE) protein 2 (PDR)